MLKYIFMTTGNKVWFDIASDLHDEGIATPVLWLGDDRNYLNVSDKFGNIAVRMLEFVHRPYNINNINYSGEYEDFFRSENYYKAKDICLKMMDRLDHYGTFSRADRECYFHNIATWALKHLYHHRPDSLIMVELAHSHAQYLIYQIACYLNLKIANFKDNPLVPFLFFQKNDGKLIQKNFKSNEELSEKMIEEVKNYTKKISKLSSNIHKTYSPPYIEQQKNNRRLLPVIKNFFAQDLIFFLKDIKFNLFNYFKGIYNPINPYQNSLYVRFGMMKKKKDNLIKACFSLAENFKFDKNYVYFPLHFEPEKSTNPEGGDFHDHFLALVALRKLLPLSTSIVVKEHPSQLHFLLKGSKGRSSLFYKLIKNIKGVIFVGIENDTFDLIRNSTLVATITGSVAIEAALVGKVGLVFGRTWYEGCPNTIKWNRDLTFEDLTSLKIQDEEKITNFLIDKFKMHGVSGFINPSLHKYFSPKWDATKVYENQKIEIKNIIKIFFKN
jgi:hypothetical protein